MPWTPSPDTMARIREILSSAEYLPVQPAPRNIKKLCRGQIEKIEQELAQGAMGKDLAERYGVSETTISFIKQGTRQSEKKYRRLLPIDVKDIKQSLSNGEQGSIIAARYGVSNATISNIKNGKR